MKIRIATTCPIARHPRNEFEDDVSHKDVYVICTLIIATTNIPVTTIPPRTTPVHVSRVLRRVNALAFVNGTLHTLQVTVLEFSIIRTWHATCMNVVRHAQGDAGGAGSVSKQT